MSWKDNLRDASFRGVSFFVPSHELQGGRRLVTHEYPLRDEPYTEDMGLKARRYGVEAYVVGDDYMSARDSLVEALNKGGEGELIHPYLGTLTVQCESYTMSEASEEGRMARFSIQFVESGESKYPDESQDRQMAVTEAADELDECAAASFAEDFDVEGWPEFVSLDALSTLESFWGRIGSTITNVKTLLSQPLALASQVQGVISAFSEKSFSSGGSSYSDISRLLTAIADGESYKSTASGSRSAQVEVRNHNALVSLIRQSAVAEAARCASAAEYETRQEAAGAAASISTLLDEEADRTMDSDLFNAQCALRTKVYTALTDEELPELMSLAISRPTASLVLAYETYGDALRCDEIVTRNNTPHPGFISGAVNLISE